MRAKRGSRERVCVRVGVCEGGSGCLEGEVVRSESWRVERESWRVERESWRVERKSWLVERESWLVERRDSVELLASG